MRNLFSFQNINAEDDTEFELKEKSLDFEKVFKYALGACKIKARVTDDDLENIANRFLPSTKAEKCFVACWLESFHVVR